MNHNPYQSLKDKKKDLLKKELFEKTISPILKANQTYMSWLFNFMRHDIKNCIQSMDSILNANKIDELTEEHLDSLKENVKTIRNVIDNFSNLTPISSQKNYLLTDVIKSIVLLNKDKLDRQNIHLNVDSNCDQVDLTYSFHSLIQIINNLIINSCKDLELQKSPKIFIQAITHKSKIEIRVYDNGSQIKNATKIFEHGYSETGGTGVGLFHVQLICSLFRGSVNVIQSDNDEYTKYFVIYLPLEEGGYNE